VNQIWGGIIKALKLLIIRHKLGSVFSALAVGLAVIVFSQNCSRGFEAASLSSKFFASAGPLDIINPEDVPRFTGKLEDPAFVQSRSRFELMYAAQDLLNDPSIGLDFVKSLPVDPKVSGFESASTQHYDETFMSARLKFAEAIAKKALRTSSLFPCNIPLQHATAFEGCPQSVLVNFAERAFRRPLAAVELQNLKALYDKNMQSAVDELNVAGRVPPKGFFDTVSSQLIARGWVLDPDWPERTVELHFYVEGAGGALEFVGNTYANQPRQDVNDHFANQGLDYQGDHGFTFVVPSRFADNQTRKIHAYAIGLGGGNPEIDNSPRDMAGAKQDSLVMALPPMMSAPVEEAIKAAMMYVMMSPSFQLRTVQSAELASSTLTAYELGNRLALYISGGLPDAQLAAKMKDGSIMRSDVYEKEARRLIASYSERFSANVMGQWMGYRDFSLTDGSTSLDQAMVRESQLVFKEILDKNMTSESILKPGFTYVNGELAKHYGLQATGANFTRVNTSDRGGILTQGALLRATAPLNATKPIVRGKWVSANILCRTIPPPSAELFQLIEDSKKLADPTWSVKQKLENHRNSGEVCQSCHKYMDPLGLALENYGPFGLWREKYDDGKPVIATGDLDGAPFSSVKDLTDIVERRDDFRECVVMKLMTHALSRPLSPEELYYVQKINRDSFGIADIIVNIAKSPAFLKQRED
jgi:Protein of unknown function (DUF1588)/Protein of unknown function (DUF1592)/Protein of unknown function (DUF1585)